MTETKKARPFETYETIVDEASLITPRNVHIRFQLPEGKEMSFKPGQFVQVFVPQKDDKPRRTSYSIASSPKEKNSFELCVTKVDGGKSSGFIHTLKKGDRVTIMGPLGRFGLPDPIERDLVFVATGSGIAPFRSMIHYLLENNTARNLYLVFGNRYDDDIIYLNEWQALQREHANLKVLLTLSRPEKWTGEKGYVGDKIEGFVPDVKNKDYFLCGLSNMINAVQEKLGSLGVPPSQIHFEKYD